MAFIAFGTWFYTRAGGYHRNEFSSELTLATGNGPLVLHTPDVLAGLALAYGLILMPYYGLLPRVVSKARIAFAYALGQFFGTTRPSFGRDEQQALLALLLKFFFVPLMINWLLGGVSDVIGHWQALAVPASAAAFLAAFDTHLYLLVFKIFLMVDVFLFTIGYVIEVPALRNEIRSVDPTVAAWLVCLACYPPFNQALSAFFPWQPSDFPKFSNPALHLTLNCLILAAMAIYASASVALGLRASNLTNRGIVTGGPYAWVRHPAYTAKNLGWWIGALPAIGASFMQSFATGLWALCSVAAWSAIYVLRALTEERHLLMAENGYSRYMQDVPYRFVPRLC
jgi:protein-S-isoprenylcysteine O-methyltransferase Ste14